MITANFVLLVTILMFWISWVAIAVAAKRSWLPVAVTYPWAFLALGLLLNYVFDWVGTFTVILLHALVAGTMVRSAINRLSESGGRKRGEKTGQV